MWVYCSGRFAIIVGAYGDDDVKSGGSGNNRGAVYVLFLNPNGTVEETRKISDTHGGLAASLDEDGWFGGSAANIGDLNNE